MTSSEEEQPVGAITDGDTQSQEVLFNGATLTIIVGNELVTIVDSFDTNVWAEAALFEPKKPGCLAFLSRRNARENNHNICLF